MDNDDRKKLIDSIRQRGIRGERVGSEPADESEHFMICPECGQAIDRRDLAQVFEHADIGHKPTKAN
jgi:hypothetical protein